MTHKVSFKKKFRDLGMSSKGGRSRTRSCEPKSMELLILLHRSSILKIAFANAKLKLTCSNKNLLKLLKT